MKKKASFISEANEEKKKKKPLWFKLLILHFASVKDELVCEYILLL